MTLREFAEIMDLVAPLPEYNPASEPTPESAPEWLLRELNIKPDRPELIWS